MITAYIDFKSLDCFLAISPILKLAADCRTPVSWQPYRSKERALPTQVASESVTQTHHRVRRESERRLQQHYAELRGLNIDLAAGKSTPASTRVAGKCGRRYLIICQQTVCCHWIDHADINDPTLLEELTPTAV